MPVPKGVSKEKFKRLEKDLARKPGVKNRYALSRYIAKRWKKGA